MKSTKTISILLVVFSLIAGCTKDNTITVVPSGNATTVQYPYINFTSLRISDAFDARITFSDTEDEVKIQADDNLQDFLDISMSGNELFVGLQEDVEIIGNAILVAHLTTNTIKNFDGSGASRIILDDELLEDEVQIKLSGASFMTGTILNKSKITVNLSGSSNVMFSGGTTSYLVNASGASWLEEYSFIVDFLDIELSGASQAWVTVNEQINVVASGASTLYYKGNGTIASQDLSGGSMVIDEN